MPVEGAVAAVNRAVLGGAPVALEAAAGALRPLPLLPPNIRPVAPGARHRLLITDRLVPGRPDTAVLRPPSLVAGVGARLGVSAEEVRGLLESALAEAGLSPDSLTALVTVEAKAGEEGLLTASRWLGVPLLAFPAAELAALPVPHPSGVPAAVAGTPSVAEAAALAGAGAGAGLVVTKVTSASRDRPGRATCAVARRGAPGTRNPRARGRGPGQRRLADRQ
ncbi:hypothetical protein GCM10009716_28970 [Streptomyces sodiiphilus]|uniref:CobE/GbiG C-terminal domain-containing protein n=2 Tax=Streptomyces sodiiphilus TaxID=226217 RepID=A0ABN2PCK2_9ACTN